MKVINIIKGIRNPKWGIKRIKQRIKMRRYKKLNLITHQNFINSIFCNEKKDFHKITKEILEHKDFNSFINNEFESANLKNRFPNSKYGWDVFLYYFIRKTKPAQIIETGCWYGSSTSLILAAIQENNYGKLYTIDFPAYPETGGYHDENPYLSEEERKVSLPYGKEPGFIVPTFLKDNWELILGTSKEELPKLLIKLGKIDMFLHDSLHSYENMMFEFNTAWKYLNKGRYAFSDNINWHTAFYDFCKNKQYYTYLAYYESPKLKHNFGAIIKQE